MCIAPPGMSPRQVVEEQMRAVHRAAERQDRLRIAHAARCETRGCHPILEAMSTTIVAIGGWLNRQSAPPERWVRISVATRSSGTTQPV